MPTFIFSVCWRRQIQHLVGSHLKSKIDKKDFMQIAYYLRRGATTFWCTTAPTINNAKMITKSVVFNVGFPIFKILN
jgi:hypothetical protein